MEHSLKIFSFFSGSGFLDLGFEKSGYKVDFVNEFCSAFIHAYEYSRQQMGLARPTYGYCNTDINVYLNDREQELRSYIDSARQDNSLIGFIGGPPCPDFSIAGKNKGKHGDNGKLSLSYIQLIVKMKPDFFLFENVKGLWRTARHREFFEELKMMLHNAGYATTERLTNALEFGVPQDRDRILLVGVKSCLLPPEYIKDDMIVNFPWRKHMKYTTEQVKAMPWNDVTPFNENEKSACPVAVQKDLTIEYWFDRNHVDTHPNAKKHFVPRTGLARMQVIGEGDVSKKSYKRLHRWRYSPTAAYGNNEVHLHPYKARRISAAEALAIQSLPAEFVLPNDLTLSDMFKTIGNGVPFLMSQGIAQTIKEFLEVVI